MVGAGQQGPRPRFENGNLTDAQIRLAVNGIWMCPIHADVIDKDPNAYTLATLKQWQANAEASAARQGDVGRDLAVHASPHEVSPRALAFARAVRDNMLPGPTRFMPEVRVDHVGRLRTFLQSVSPFLPSHPLQGIEVSLVEVQRQVISDLSTHAHFIERSDLFWLDTGRGLYVANDRSESGATIRTSESTLARLHETVDRIAARWGRGEGYYPER
jgi:hypothetical protein